MFADRNRFSRFSVKPDRRRGVRITAADDRSSSDEDERHPEVQRRMAQSRTLAEITQRSLEGLGVDEMAQEVCTRTADALDTDLCDIFELQPDGDELVLRAGVGWPEEAYDEVALSVSEGSQSGYTVQHWEPTVVEDIREDERFRRPSLFEELDVLSGITVVVPSPGRPWGIFGVHSYEPRAFDEMDEAFVLSMSHVLSQAVAQRRSEREKERFASLVQHVQEYAIFDCDPEGRVQTWNAGAQRIFGYDEETILGEPIDTFYTEPDRQADLPEERLQAARAEGSTQEEGWRVQADGSRFWVDETIRVRRAGDDVLGFSTIVRDKTDQREYERELERSERRYRTLVENFPNGNVGLFDEDLVYRAVGGELFDEIGVDVSEERLGQSIHDVYADEIVDELEPHYRAALEGEHRSFKIEAYGRDLLMHTLPVRDGDGEIFAGMVMSQDISDQVAYEEKLEESNKQLESFAYAASHDLQEPLRTVTSYLQLVDDRYSDRLDEHGREFVQHAVDGAQRMSRMIDSLLEYARVTTQGGELEPVDAQAVLDDARSDLQLHIDETGAELTVEQLPTIAADPDQLAQVFRNLIANALKYSGDEPPRIHVGAEPEDDRWRFWVQDHGVGIAPAEHDDVFDVFKRVEDHEHEEHGTGIGLAICRQIVDRHGGDMWVDSELGEGSTFHFTMPAADGGTPSEADR